MKEANVMYSIMILKPDNIMRCRMLYSRAMAQAFGYPFMRLETMRH